MSVTTSSRSSASERSSSGSAEESWTVNPHRCGQRSKMLSSRTARSSSSGGSSAFRLPSWAGFMRLMPQGPCPCSAGSVQISDERLAAQQVFRLRPGRHGRADGTGDRVVHLVVLRLAKARRERDLENEKLARERRRIDVIRQARAVAHAEPEKLGTTGEHRLDALVDALLHGAHGFLP